ncbi:hypothetical protein F7U66_01775 [Vibrio parahaemolyticus]|nr:hypothetical protein [Vibrio parahaemolyticus]
MGSTKNVDECSNKCCKICAESAKLHAEASKLKADAFSVVYQVRYQAWVSLLKTVIWAMVVGYSITSDLVMKIAGSVG